AAGRRLAPVLTSAFRSIQDAVEEVVSDKAVLTISTTPSFATLWLVPRLLDFHARYADYEVHLTTTTRPADLFRERRVDVAIRYGHGSYEGLHRAPLFDEAIGAYVSPRLDRAETDDWRML